MPDPRHEPETLPFLRILPNPWTANSQSVTTKYSVTFLIILLQCSRGQSWAVPTLHGTVRNCTVPSWKNPAKLNVRTNAPDSKYIVWFSDRNVWITRLLWNNRSVTTIAKKSLTVQPENCLVCWTRTSVDLAVMLYRTPLAPSLSLYTSLRRLTVLGVASTTFVCRSILLAMSLPQDRGLPLWQNFCLSAKTMFSKSSRTTHAKSSSCYPIPACLFKSCLGELLLVITRIINSSLQSSVVPSVFKHAIVTSLLKKPNLASCDLANYPCQLSIGCMNAEWIGVRLYSFVYIFNVLWSIAM